MLLALVYTYRQGRVDFEYLSDWVKILSASGGEADGRPGMFADSGRKMILSTTVTGFIGDVQCGEKASGLEYHFRPRSFLLAIVNEQGEKHPVFVPG